MSDQHLSPREALARIFQVVQEEAAANPTFARRLLDAAGVTVTFAGPDASKVLDPVIVALRGDQASFRETLATFPEADLKKMITDHGLGTKDDVAKVKTKPKKLGYIDILWAGASRKAGKG